MNYQDNITVENNITVDNDEEKNKMMRYDNTKITNIIKKNTSKTTSQPQQNQAM